MSAEDKLIVTAGSAIYGPYLLGLLGSLNLNWPLHPPVLVYDLGLNEETLALLRENQISVKTIEPFCDHWRKHFAWKIWCLNDAPATNILWMDAGLVVLKPLEEVFHAINRLEYFIVPNYQLLDLEASERACEGCGVPIDFRIGKLSIAANFLGMRKTGKMREILSEALEVSLTEKHIAATKATHRHDQAILSLLLYKHFGQLIFGDGLIYSEWRSPCHTNGQKVWLHRRGLLSEDIAHFAAHIQKKGKPYMPDDPNASKRRKRIPSLARKIYKNLRRNYFFPLSHTSRATDRSSADSVYDGIRD